MAGARARRGVAHVAICKLKIEDSRFKSKVERIENSPGAIAGRRAGTDLKQ